MRANIPRYVAHGRHPLAGTMRRTSGDVSKSLSIDLMNVAYNGALAAINQPYSPLRIWLVHLSPSSRPIRGWAALCGCVVLLCTANTERQALLKAKPVIRFAA
jgi:hypothetical protein